MEEDEGGMIELRRIVESVESVEHLPYFLGDDVDWDGIPLRACDNWVLLVPHSIKARWATMEVEARAAVILTAWFAFTVRAA